jgi:hypothetical protein
LRVSEEPKLRTSAFPNSLPFYFFLLFYLYRAEHLQSPNSKVKQYNEKGNNKQDRKFGNSELLTVSSSEGGGSLARFERRRQKYD